MCLICVRWPQNQPTNQPIFFFFFGKYFVLWIPSGLDWRSLSSSFFQTLLDRFDYDDEPEAGDEAKKDETPSVQPTM